MKIIHILFILMLFLPSVFANVDVQTVELLLNQQDVNYKKYLEDRDKAIYEAIDDKYREYEVMVEKEINQILLKFALVYAGVTIILATISALVYNFIKNKFKGGK